jgi:ABC-type dipeptide/oligopeptide/nickel transport system permease component
MLVFAVRRTAHAVLCIIVTTFLVYVGAEQLGDPFLNVGPKILPPDIQAALRAKFGMDKPFPIRYLIYLKNLFTGEFGVDFEQRRPVGSLLAAMAPGTIRLALLATVLALATGVAAGVIAAVWHRTFLDALVSLCAVLLICVPGFALAVLLNRTLSGYQLFGVELFTPVPHSFTLQSPWYKEDLLPAVVLAAGEGAFLARLMRTSMLDVLAADYLRTARAKGLSEPTVVIKHGIRNAIIPIVNYAGVFLGIFLGGVIIVEQVFQLDGLGSLFAKALVTNNTPVIMAVAVVSIVAFIIASAVVDMFCAWLDPRIRLN